jgi:hypothetical protein
MPIPSHEPCVTSALWPAITVDTEFGNGLAGPDYQAHRYARTEPLHKRTMTGVDRALGPEHLYVGTSLSMGRRISARNLDLGLDRIGDEAQMMGLSVHRPHVVRRRACTAARGDLGAQDDARHDE